MTAAAIIAGSLVDAKNVNSHKCMRLIIDVPAENALKVIAAFGWPTMVNPVSVAVARLNPEAANRKEAMPIDGANATVATTPRPSAVPASAAGADNRPSEVIIREDRDAWPDRQADMPTRKSPAQIAGYLCTTVKFQKFLREYPETKDIWRQNWVECENITDNNEYAATAATVRQSCGVKSRAELTDKNIEWNALLLAFRLWENHPELEDA